MEDWKQIYTSIEIRSEDVDKVEDFKGAIDDAIWLIHLRLAHTLDPCQWNKLRLGIFEDLLEVSGIRKSVSKTH